MATETKSKPKVHKCKYGCGYEGKRGPLNLHELYRCPVMLKGSQQRSADKLKPASELRCDCEEGPTLAILKPSISAHAYWIRQGKTKYCTECEEVF